jgi:hypothetical protein
MTNFDLAEVRQFAAEIDARLQRCENGEGFECTNLDGTLRQYAILCRDFTRQVRDWGRAVFYGQAAFDPEVEQVWLAHGFELLRRASELWEYGQERDGECFVLESGAALGAALWQLERLLKGWTSPQLAISPVARQGVTLSASEMEEAQQRLSALPSLPENWQPADPRRQHLIRKLRPRN